jgi:hypothetical protein
MLEERVEKAELAAFAEDEAGQLTAKYKGAAGALDYLANSQDKYKSDQRKEITKVLRDQVSLQSLAESAQRNETIQQADDMVGKNPNANPRNLLSGMDLSEKDLAEYERRWRARVNFYRGSEDHYGFEKDKELLSDIYANQEEYLNKTPDELNQLRARIKTYRGQKELDSLIDEYNREQKQTDPAKAKSKPKSYLSVSGRINSALARAGVLAPPVTGSTRAQTSGEKYIRSQAAFSIKSMLTEAQNRKGEPLEIAEEDKLIAKFVGHMRKAKAFMSKYGKEDIDDVVENVFMLSDVPDPDDMPEATVTRLRTMCQAAANNPHLKVSDDKIGLMYVVDRQGQAGIPLLWEIAASGWN